MEGRLIGIDLGSKFIKVCKILSSNQKKKELEISSAIVDVSSLSDSDKVSTLSLMLKKIDCLEESVYLAVGGKDILNRELLVKKKNIKNLKEHIIKEFENSSSEDLQKMYTSYFIAKNFSDKEYNIIFSAVSMEKVNSIYSLINSIETMKVVGVTLEALALTNAFNEFGPNYKNNENIIIANIGHNVTNIVVLSSKEIVFVKDIEFGGYDITRTISDIYSIPEKISEELKRRDDFKQEISLDMKKIFKKSVAPLIENLYRTIEYCVTRQTIVSIDRIVLTGGGAIVSDIDRFIEETLGIPTEKWNPLEGIKVSGYVNKPQGYFLPVALGLAIEKEKK